MKKISSFWIRSGVSIWWPEQISIGLSSLNEDIFMNGKGGISIGDRVLIGHRTTLFSDEHIFDDINEYIWFQGNRAAPICIEDDVYIGCNVVILAGVVIGQGAVVGAGSIVTKDVPPLSVVCGNPAKIIKFRGEGN